MSSAKKNQERKHAKTHKTNRDENLVTKNVYITITYIILETFIEEAI